jgi:hypothetical protein
MESVHQQELFLLAKQREEDKNKIVLLQKEREEDNAKLEHYKIMRQLLDDGCDHDWIRKNFPKSGALLPQQEPRYVRSFDNNNNNNNSNNRNNKRGYNDNRRRSYNERYNKRGYNDYGSEDEHLHSNVKSNRVYKNPVGFTNDTDGRNLFIQMMMESRQRAILNSSMMALVLVMMHHLCHWKILL